MRINIFRILILIFILVPLIIFTFVPDEFVIFQEVIVPWTINNILGYYEEYLNSLIAQKQVFLFVLTKAFVLGSFYLIGYIFDKLLRKTFHFSWRLLTLILIVFAEKSSFKMEGSHQGFSRNFDIFIYALCYCLLTFFLTFLLNFPDHLLPKDVADSSYWMIFDGLRFPLATLFLVEVIYLYRYLYEKDQDDVQAYSIAFKITSFMISVYLFLQVLLEFIL